MPCSENWCVNSWRAYGRGRASSTSPVHLHAEQLSDHLRKQALLPVYLISGDEPLQMLEIGDRLRAVAREAGYSQRDVLEVGGGFDWNLLLEAAGSLSLFGDRRVIDLRLASAKIGAEGSKAVVAYLADPPPDTLLLISAPKLDRSQLSTKWVKAIDGHGALLRIWPIDGAGLPNWLTQRMRDKGLRPAPEVAGLLAERVEGNLLAAAQEIDKLLLLNGPGPLDADTLLDAVADSARFDVFGLVDAALAGDPRRVSHRLEGLRAEGVAVALVLWSLAREIRMLARIAYALEAGGNLSRLLAAEHVWEKRRPLLEKALRRLRVEQWRRLLLLCQQTDQAIKGRSERDAWLLLGVIASALSGRPVGRRAVCQRLTSS